jgi:hypothetical protein
MRTNSEETAVSTAIRFNIRHLLLLILVAAVCTAIVRQIIIVIERSRIGRAEFRNAEELAGLDSALEWYGVKYGELPPTSGRNAVIRHLFKSHPRVREPAARIQADGHDIHELDDTEVLVLFLSGQAEEMLTGSSSSAYDFDGSRLVDSDGDGWLEYVGRDGQTFRLIDGHSAIYCEASDRLISLDTLRSQR